MHNKIVHLGDNGDGRKCSSFFRVNINYIKSTEKLQACRGVSIRWHRTNKNTPSFSWENCKWHREWKIQVTRATLEELKEALKHSLIGYGGFLIQRSPFNVASQKERLVPEIKRCVWIIDFRAQIRQWEVVSIPELDGVKFPSQISKAL